MTTDDEQNIFIMSIRPINIIIIFFHREFLNVCVLRTNILLLIFATKFVSSFVFLYFCFFYIREKIYNLYTDAMKKKDY